MRVRLLLGIVGLLALLGGLSACKSNASAATVRTGVWVEVSPSTANAGSRVVVRADCVDNTGPATVTSRAFATVTLHPSSTVLIAEAQVATNVKEGGFEVTVTCRSGATATTTLFVVSGDKPMKAGPRTGGGFLAGDDGNGFSGPVIWLAGGGASLIAAAVLAAVSVRRKRRAPTA